MVHNKEVIDNMKSDSFDMTYTSNGLQNKINTGYATVKKYSTPAEVEAVVKALGTMILMPEYSQDPLNIGSKKHFEGNTQVPILMDKNREIVEAKLVELISNL